MFRFIKLKNSLVLKLFLSICLILVPMTIILIVNNYYSADMIKRKVAQSNEKMLSFNMNQIDQQLENVGNFIYQFSKQSDLTYLQDSPDLDYNDYIFAKLKLYNHISSLTDFYQPIDSFFIYSSDFDEIIYSQRFGEDYNERIKISNEIKKIMKEADYNLDYGKWNILEGEHQRYLLTVINNDGVFIGAWIDIEKLIIPLENLDYGELGMIVLSTYDLKPLTNKELLKSEGIILKETSEPYSIKGKSDQYIVMSEQSVQAKFSMTALMPNTVVLEQLPFIHQVSLYITIGSILFLILFAILMRHIFLLPIARIVQAMEKLRQGDLDVRLPKVKSSMEFELMNDSFNDMISDIQHLKIDVYEKKLNLQRSELKQLQLQINPHFFLNSLNIIYNLATVKEFSLIQQMSQYLVRYFRFMFKSDSYFVSLEDELMHTLNYLKIQELRFPNAFTYEIEVDEKFNNIKIPPLVIQTFVENTIKHALNFDETLEIIINGWLEKPTDNHILIQIRDSGEGFPSHILSQLKENQPLITNSGDRVGIWNAKRRLELLYGDNCANIEFLNQEGAVILIRLPIDKVE